MLYRDVVQRLQRHYLELFRRAIPNLRINPDSIEIIDHGLSTGEFSQDFLDCGLGISVRELYKREIASTQVGYTGKLLAWLPGQFMPEHRHRDILALPRDKYGNLAEFPDSRIVRLENLVADFSGLVGFDNKNHVFFTQAEDILTLDVPRLPKDSVIIPGKAETFDIIYGEGSFFLSGSETNSPRYDIPESQKSYVKNRNEHYLKAGQQLRLPPNTPHAARASPNGMVAIEYSMPSRDEADIFTDTRIKRKTEIRDR